MGYSPIHNPDRNEIHFNLAYATSHFAGKEVMRTAEFGGLSEHDRTLFAKSITKQGPSLFDGMMDEMKVEGPYLRTRKINLKTAFKTLSELLSANPAGIKFGQMAAIAQQSQYLKRSELGDVIVDMAELNIVKKTWLVRNGRKPSVKDLILPY